MPIKKRLVLGLTGSFGSGCTTLKKSLEKLGFSSFSLSKYVKDEWEKKTGKKIAKAKRPELQDMGNELRKNYKVNYLARLAIKEAKSKAKGKDLVFDNIRNLGEVKHLRRVYQNFFLIAVDCSPKVRWDRIKEEYKRFGFSDDEFEDDDKRDKYEEGKDYGQQVELCVDDADVLIDNDKTFPTKKVAISKLKSKIFGYVNLMNGKFRPPTPFESYMSIAYSASLMSQCIKRRVGSVIVDEKNDAILAVGYNENPAPIKPCIHKYLHCYRDIYKEVYFEDLERRGGSCPKCNKKLENLSYPFICKKCGFDLDRHYIKDKAMNRCTALHAEEKAILNAGSRNIAGYTIYVTTFPCFTCSQKIVYSNLKSVVYVQPYPDPDSTELLAEAGISVRKFEGVKAKAYFRLFVPWQREMEQIVSNR